MPVSRAHDSGVGIMVNAEALLPDPGSLHPTVHADGDQIAVWLAREPIASALRLQLVQAGHAGSTAA